MDEENVALYHSDDAVAVITMNRPDKRNALSPALKARLIELFRRAEADDAIAVVVLRGAGKTFCAGADVSPSPEKEARKGDGLKTYANHRKTLDFHMTPWGLSKPVIAAVQGHAMGAGCELAMMCDMTIAADSAVLGEPEIRFASIGSALVMPWIIGHKRARQLLYFGDTITAERAEQIGMVNLVVPAADLEAETMKFAKRLALVGRETLEAVKHAVNRGIEAQGFRAGMEAAVDIVGLIHTSKIESDEKFYEVVRNEGPGAAFRWRNAQFKT